VEPFTYERPTTVDEAVACLAADGARALAGGTDLIPQVREGRRRVGRIVDLKHVPELTAIRRTADGAWTIGAAVSVAALGAHASFAVEHTGLLASARLVGSLQVQSRASLGGNLCNAAPSADAVPLLVSLAAEAEIAGSAGRRRLPVGEVATGPGRTALRPGELVVALHLPPRRHREAARYLRFTPRREMDIAIAGAGAVLRLDARGAIEEARITLASVAPVPLRADAAAKSLVGRSPDAAAFEEAARLAADAATPISDTRGSAEYRRELVAVLTRRALMACRDEIAAGEPA
jgi:carbon-monoxide dehydrogenase medium subunit